MNNELIKRLSDQAHAEQLDSTKSIPEAGRWELLFAQLVVQECARIVEPEQAARLLSYWGIDS